MDQRRSDIGQDVKDIVQTRNAISQKIEMLEHRFHETVEETKTSVEDMVDRVKDAADDIVGRTKQTFDPTYHVDQRPWTMVGGAILVGYIIGTMRSRSRHPSYMYPAAASQPMPRDVGSRSGQLSRYQTSLWGDVGKEISNEIEHAKHALIQAGRSFVQDFFIQVLPALAQSFGSRRPNERPNDRSQGTRGNGSEFQRDV
jgi:ElaB/YqjD/DUF883 family membrane-anchored ribosome-binding protein